ncbi:MAG: peptidylprolyl isomerase [Kofleriaceae bacterium]
MLPQALEDGANRAFAVGAELRDSPRRRGKVDQRMGLCSLRALIVGVAIAGAAGACRPPRRPAPDPTAELRREIAAAEARRGASVEALLPMLGGGDPLRGALAMRALGRIGGTTARASLIAALRCEGTTSCNPGLVRDAAGALGMSIALDEPLAAELAATSAALWGALARAIDPAVRASLLEALGRAGLPDVQPALTEELRGSGVTAEAAAIALGRHGRRRLPWSDLVRTGVVRATAHAERDVRYAATWALSRESLDPATAASATSTIVNAEVAAALTRRVSDDDAQIRAVALAGLTRRGLAPAATAAITAALYDRDWRVAVEALRARAAVGDPEGADLIAAAVGGRVRALAQDSGGAPGDAPLVVEGLRLLAEQGARPQVATELRAAMIAAESIQVRAPVAAGWIRCLAGAALERAAAEPQPGQLLTCGGGALAEAYAATAVADLIAAKAGSADARRAAADALWSSTDPRVRAALLTSLRSLESLDPQTALSLLTRLQTGLAGADGVVASAAIDAVGRLIPAAGLPFGLDPTLHARLDSLVASAATRAGTEQDPELASALLEFLTERKVAQGEASCRRAAVHPNPAVVRAALHCLAALGASASPPSDTPPAAEPPPVDLALAVGKSWRWTVTTTHGDVVIQLAGTVAPWHVATIVMLTQRGFYDGLEFHRVVPNFVVQGGDPTQSGSGGPGFALPAEPGSRVDGDLYDVGAVGFADAGKDTGGSQWFVMHSRAPHLEGRYTRVGQVIEGQDVIDRLLVGDRVVRARVTAVDAPPAR